MKKIVTLIITVLCAATLFAQAPEKFTYQAVVRNASNVLVVNAPVGVRVSILQGGINGNLAYMETQTAVTNANGLITLQIGGGSVQQGVFADIDWANGPYFLKTETDPNGGSDYSVTSVQQLLSVPYALYSKEAGNGFSGDYNDLTNLPQIPQNVSELTNDAGYITMDSVPAIPTNVSAFNNDAGYLTGYTETDPQFNAWDKDYNDLINTPTIPTVPENVSTFTNDAGYITTAQIPAQVNADWNATTGVAEILNKPTIPTVPSNVSAFTNDAGYITSADIPEISNVPTNVSAFTNDAGYITAADVPAQVNADWNATSGAAQILHKPTLFSGNYNDLTNRPTIPTVPTNVSAFTNDAGYITSEDIPEISNVPTNVSAFNNDAGYITTAQIPAQVNADWNATSGVARILNKPTIPTVPANVGAFTNDAHYITEAQLNALLAAMNNTIDSLRDRIEELEANPPAPQEGLPTVITLQPTNVTGTSAQCGGNIPYDGGSTITERGVCWGVSLNPTVSGDHITDGTAGAGSFFVNLYDLQSGITYHVRAYATNSVGTQYGDDVTFTTATPTVDGEPCPGMPTVTDADGNVYPTVAIGQQCWMKENLKTTQFADGTAIPWSSSNSTVPNRYNPGGNASNVNTYGYLYNWYAVMNGNASSNSNPSPVQGVCPSGWHVPSNMEWSQLTGYVSAFTDFQCDNNAQNIAKALAATTNWTAIGSILCAVGYNTNNNNSTGFSALPAGTRTGNVGSDAYFWTCTQSDVSTAYAIGLSYNSPSLTVSADNAKTAGFAVRCVSDIAIAGGVTQVVVTGGVTSITENSAVCGGSVIMDNGTTITARGVCWSTSPHPTTDNDHTTETAGLGGFTSNLTGLAYGTTYYVRAYAVIGGETFYGSEVFFTTLTPFICGTGTVTDYDGNVYNTVQIGDQCWMKENMRTKHYANGTAISGTGTNYYNPQNTTTYGYLYTYYAARSSSNICPTGWHVPSDGEWIDLTQFVSNQSQFLCSNNTSYIAKALASTTGWNSSTGTCVVGLTPGNNNATGFSALPAGSYFPYNGQNYFGSGAHACFWTSTPGSSGKAWTRSINGSSSAVSRNETDIYYEQYNSYNNYTYYYYYHSVRCLRD